MEEDKIIQLPVEVWAAILNDLLKHNLPPGTPVAISADDERSVRVVVLLSCEI